MICPFGETVVVFSLSSVFSNLHKECIFSSYRRRTLVRFKLVSGVAVQSVILFVTRYFKVMFNQLKKGITVNNTSYNLSELIAQCSNKWTEPEWGFPKGRREYHETDVDCSKREFQEETGILSRRINMILNVIPYEETFMGSNYKSYKHKYFLGFMNNNNKGI